MTLYDDAKHWWASRSLWFASLLVACGAVVEYVNSTSGLLAPYFGKWGGLATVAIGVLNVLLRLVTTRPIGKPSPVKAGGTD